MEPGFANMNASTNGTTVSYSLAYGELIFGAIVVIIILITGIVGNSMIILSVILSKRLRTSTNAFVVSLSVADLLTCLFLPWYAVAFLGKNGWVLPKAEWLCGATGFMIFTCTGVSLYNLAAIGVNRLIYLTRPFLYPHIYKPWVVAIMIAFTWLIPGGILIILLLSGIGGFGYETVDYPSCSDLDDVSGADAFDLAQTVVGLPVPLITIIVCYTWILIHIKRHFKRTKRRESELARYSTIDPESEAGKRGQEKMDQITRQELEITKNLFLVVCAFFTCFLIFFVANVIDNAGHFVFYAALPTFANSAINFFIYASRHPQFKVVLRCMITCKYHDIPEPSDFLKKLIARDEWGQLGFSRSGSSRGSSRSTRSRLSSTRSQKTEAP